VAEASFSKVRTTWIQPLWRGTNRNAVGKSPAKIGGTCIPVGFVLTIVEPELHENLHEQSRAALSTKLETEPTRRYGTVL
jgi:hypothetical protein